MGDEHDGEARSSATLKRKRFGGRASVWRSVYHRVPTAIVTVGPDQIAIRHRGDGATCVIDKSRKGEITYSRTSPINPSLCIEAPIVEDERLRTIITLSSVRLPRHLRRCDRMG